MVQESLEMRKARDKEAWGMVGFCRDAEGPQEDSRIGWSLEAEILRHKVEWEAGRWARPRSRGFAHRARDSENKEQDGQPPSRGLLRRCILRQEDF